MAQSDIGHAVAIARKARGLSQEELAGLAMISVSMLRKIERGNRSLTPAVHAALAGVLGPLPMGTDGGPEPDRVSRVLPLLREIMDSYDIPADEAPAPRTLHELRHLTATATAFRLASRYAQLADLLPGSIIDLTRTALTRTGHEQERAFGLLALAYRAADAIADKHGCHDLSARATELTRWAAARSGDPLQELMATYVRAELFFTGTLARKGLLILDRATGPPPPDSDVLRLAMYGALHMRAAVLAARAGLAEEAADRMAEATAAARHVPDGIYYGTAYGPSSVHVHELAAAVESGSVSRALQFARQWQPPRSLPGERRSHFYIEAARAYQWAGDNDKAVTALYDAQQAAPQHTRYNPTVAETVKALIRSRRKLPPRLLHLAAWIGVT